MINIGFVGMTHLGIIYSIAAASKGHDVLCYDQDLKKISRFSNGNFEINEPDLDNTFKDCSHNMVFTSNVKNLSKCDIIYLSEDVPTDANGNSDLKIIKKKIEEVKNNISEKGILVILCQVPPGFTSSINFDKTRLYYQVETLVFGDAIYRSLFPERLIIGSNNKKNNLKRKFENFLKTFNCDIFHMNYESAELTKISINACLVSTITVTNVLSELCENIHADWSDIEPALRLDRRIGLYSYLKPGLGISGGNLERDLSTIIKLGRKKRTDLSVIDAFILDSVYRKKWVLRKINQLNLNISLNTKIGILGLTYKENTHSLKNSPSIERIKSLPPECIIKVYEPVIKSLKDNFNKNISFSKNVEDAIFDIDLLLIMTPWKDFKKLKLSKIKELMKKNIIIDPFAVFDSFIAEKEGFRYFSLGK